MSRPPPRSTLFPYTTLFRSLYSALSKVNNMDVNIMTAEDPVEYNLMGINQVLVRTEIGLTFAAALKAFLRQDPNIIMIGEVRDPETGGIFSQAGRTGPPGPPTIYHQCAPRPIPPLNATWFAAANRA